MAEEYNGTTIVTTISGFGNMGVENTTTASCNTSTNTSCSDGSSTTPHRGLIGFGHLENYNELWVAYYINMYYLKILAGIGIPGNVFSVVIISLMRPMTSFSIYVAALAFADMLALVSKILYIELTRHSGRLGLWGCRWVRFATSFCPMNANWFLVVMTIERAAAIWLPMKVHRYFTKKSATIVLLVCVLIMIALNSPIMWMMRETFDTANSYDCDFIDEYKYFVNKIWTWFDGALSCAFPCVLLVGCNVMIMIRIRRMNKLHEQMIHASTSSEMVKQQSQMNMMLIIVSLTFVVLSIPYVIYSIIKSDMDFFTAGRLSAWNWLIKQLVFLLYDSSHAINFFMYFLSGRKFRAKCLEIVLCRKNKPRAITYAASTASPRINTVV